VTKDALDTAGLPEHVQVSLAEIAATAREGVLALSVACGLEVVQEIFSAEVARICGQKGKHDPDRAVYRHGAEPRLIPLGGALVGIDKPRMRSVSGTEVALPSFEVFAGRDLLDEIALGRMLAGLSTRRYRAGAEPVGNLDLRGTTRSAVSRRFTRATQAKLAELFSRDLSELDLLAVFIDGMHVGDHLIVVGLGVDSQGVKHPLGLWEGSTENKAVCSALISNLTDRGLPPDRALLFVIDGGKAIRSAIEAVWGSLALVQRCRLHKERNITDHLPRSERALVARKLRAAWSNPDAAAGERELRSIAKHLELAHPGAAASLREGLEDTLTVTRLGLPPSLARTFKSTNPIESMISIARDATRNVKRWRSGEMAMRWIAAGMFEAEKQFRKVNGHHDMHILARALERHTEMIERRPKVA
jgi:transposase-like protein